MGEEDKAAKAGGVPSWQIKKADTSEETKQQSSDSSAQETPSRASIVEQAKKFLQEDEVRNSTTDKQIAFLETKGLNSNEIESLLGITRNSEATNPQPEVSSPSVAISIQNSHNYTEY
jgi:hypothetical protein